mmetsp:Transcript_5522/g.4719  ORF Transcript_5522/g.4719 Transcript_5522/m.4719 type:complete len:131 (-) Transcript_5522:14-406(-)
MYNNVSENKKSKKTISSNETNKSDFLVRSSTQELDSNIILYPERNFPFLNQNKIMMIISLLFFVISLLILWYALIYQNNNAQIERIKADKFELNNFGNNCASNIAYNEIKELREEIYVLKEQIKLFINRD